MEIIASQKYLLLSPRKIRPVVELIKKMRPVEAIEKLPFVDKKASEPLAKVIKQALANARVKGLSENDLYFKEIQIGEGPRLKRGRAVSRGQWHPIKKRMSHIRIVLEVRKSEIKDSKSETLNPKTETSTKSKIQNKEMKTDKKVKKEKK
jgi:large subunit ribosomal protein L22